ncbi:MAG: hypothetical protein DCC58_12045, partial [Chloroflexi bacterium]
MIFTPDTPLGQEVQRLLLEADAGMTVLEIRRALRLKGKAIEERNLRELLGHVSVFTSLAGDRFCLRGSVRSLDHTSTSRDVRASGEVPTIVNLVTATEEYVVVDLETTGLDPEADRVIQLVAVRYTDGKPHAVLERYLNPAPAVISQSIRQKLGLEQRPDLLDEIEQASSLTDCADAVRAFLGDRPIVAHNGRFDLQFLKAGLGELSNPLVDTLELALLMAPGLGNYQLASVAEHFGVTPEDAREIWHAVQEDSGAEIDVGWLHNAITDACLTAATYRRLLDAWTHDGRPSGAVIRKLLPELCGDTWTGEPVMIESALGTAVGPVPPGPAHPPVLLPPLTQTDVMDMLDRYRVLRGFESRAGQQEMLGYVWRALQDDRYAMIEAPTGTGKTVAYLLPALAHAASTGGRVVISTPLRNLQDQVLDELDALRSSSGVAFQCQVLKGAANYVCLDRLARYIAELGPNAPTEERFVLAYLLALICERPNATIEDLSPWCRFTFPITVHVTGAVSAAVDGCSSLRCRDLGCALPRSAEGARGAHVVVVNHALWLAEPARMPEFQHIIVDEAHALEDAATLAFTREVSRETLLDLLDRLFDRRTQRGAIVRVQAVVPTIEVRDLARQAFAAIERLRVLVPDFGARLAAYLRTRDARID